MMQKNMIIREKNPLINNKGKSHYKISVVPRLLRMEVGRDAVNSEHSGSFVNILVPCVILSKLKISSIGVVLNF